VRRPRFFEVDATLFDDFVSHMEERSTSFFVFARVRENCA
jgi:hypothetical protein